MIRRSFLLVSMIVALSTGSCIKETYNMNMLSKEECLSPTLVISAIIGNVTIKDLNIDLNVRISNLQIMDTIDNFMKVKKSENNNLVKPENFEKLRVNFAAKNGLPLRVSLQMSLYNSSTHTIKSTVNATGFLEAAPVDKNGKVTKVTETLTSIELTRQFLSSIPMSDKIIFQFTFSTSNNGTDYVSIYSDYKISFKAALVMKPDINL